MTHFHHFGFDMFQHLFCLFLVTADFFFLCFICPYFSEAVAVAMVTVVSGLDHGESGGGGGDNGD